MRSSNEYGEWICGTKKKMWEPRGIVAEYERVFGGRSPSFVRSREPRADAERVEANRALARVETPVSSRTEPLWPVDDASVDRITTSARQCGGRERERHIFRSKDRRQEGERQRSRSGVEPGLPRNRDTAARPDGAVVGAVWEFTVVADAHIR